MTRKILRVTSVQVAGPSRLALTFSDGSSGVADLAGHLSGHFAPLADAERFAGATVEGSGVSWPDADIDAAAEWLYALAHGLPTPVTLNDVARNELTVSLRELRLLAGKTQEDVAEAAGIAQSAVSRFEGRDDALLSSLRRYVEALGGELQVVAQFGGRSMRIGGIG